jgi:CRP-like cAMP-binding protein
VLPAQYGREPCAPQQQTAIGNRLLASLSPEDFASLQPHLKPVSLDTRQVLIEPNTPIAHIYFPEAGMSSVTNNSSGGEIEVGVVGREGLVALPNLGLDPPVRRAVTCYLLAVTMGAIASPSQTHVGPASPSRFT